MPRRTGDDLNELKIRDNKSNCDLVLYYRNPTTKEQVAYTNGLIVRKGKKMVSRQGEMRMKYGAMILAGIRTGDFEKKQGGQWVPYASDTASEDYDAGWKDLICEYASDLVELLAVHAFESPAEIADAEDEPGEEDKEDLEKN